MGRLATKFSERAFERFRQEIVEPDEIGRQAIVTNEERRNITMALTELIPWKRSGSALAPRQDLTFRPFQPFEGFRREMDRLFDGFLSDWSGRTFLMDGQMGDFMPQIDMVETDKEVRLTAELPGMESKDVEVTFSQGVLHLKGEKRARHEEKGTDFHRTECRYGAFERAIQLPVDIDADKAKATFKSGVLTVTLPKTAEAQSSRKRIPIEG
jgi:HSP20 family protein